MGCAQSHKMRDQKITKITQEEKNNQLEKDIDDAFGGRLSEALDQMDRQLQEMLKNKSEANQNMDVQPSQ